jgi:octaprenyl-diphosphate synthase
MTQATRPATAHAPGLPGDVVADLAQVEGLLAELLASDVPVAEQVARYGVEGGGKRVRPTIVLLFARSLGAPLERSHDLAAVVEWVHAASLLHDDVLDAAEQRRGRPAAHRAFGIHSAVMTGDYLLARALQRLLRDGDADGAGRRLGDAVAKLAEGELLEAALRGRLDVSEEQVMAVADRKTAALISWAAEAGALAAGADREICDAARRYGLGMGRAFQLVDDALDYELQRDTGKDRLLDLRAGLPTLPLLHALESDPGLRHDAERLQADWSDTLASEIGARVRACGGAAYARDLAKGEARVAVSQLRFLPSGPHRRTLARVAVYITRRRS